MMRRAVVAALLLFLPLQILSAAQEEPKSPRVIYFGTQVVGHGPEAYGEVYLVTGDDHHSVAMMSEDQVILVDTKSTPGWGAPILRRLNQVTIQPVATVINTNPRQGGSNGEFPKAVDIIAHENTRKRMAMLPGVNAKTLPNKTFTDKLSFPVKTIGEVDGTDRVDLFHFGPGYSDGDTVVVFPQYNSLFMGELYPGKTVPHVDTAMGGSALRFPDTLDKAFATLKTYTAPFQTVVRVREMPRLSQAAMVVTWGRLADIEEYAAFVRALVDAGRASHKAGKTVDQAVAGLSLPARFKEYRLDQLRQFMQAVYDESR